MSSFFCFVLFFYFSTTILVYIIGPLLPDFFPQGKILPIFIQPLSTYFLSYSSTYIAGNNSKYLCSKQIIVFSVLFTLTHNYP